MALIFTSDEDVQLFTGVDPYRYDVDNRPLRKLIQNDINLNTELSATTAEVVTARTDNSTGTPITYSSLDARLEALSIAGLANSSVSYSIFQASAERNRALFQSGWLVPPTTKDYNSAYGTTAFAGDDFAALLGSKYSGFNEPNTLFLNTEFDGLYSPIPLVVNGWLIRLSWLNAGGTAGGASTSYPNCTIKMPAPPTSGGREDFVFLEVWLKEISSGSPVFWLYGSPQYKAAIYGEGTPVLCTTSDPTNVAFETGNYTINPLDPRVVHTLSRLNNGNWLQVQCRLRIVANIDPTIDDPFSGSNATIVLAQGTQGAPVSGKPFTNMLGTLADSGLWRAGAGSADSSTLGTYDGRSYAVPVAVIHRRNTAAFSMQDQNGSKKTNPDTTVVGGTMASGISGRPDGKFYDEIDRKDFLDLRLWTNTGSMEYERLMQKAFDDIIGGKSRSQWQQLTYPAGPQNSYGNRLLVNDTIFDNTVYPIGSNAEMTNSNWVIDKSVDPAVAYSKPDGVRRLFATSKLTQRLEFWIDPFTNTSQFTTSNPGFVTVSGSGTSRTVNINPQILSGTIGNKINTARVPVWHWQTDNQGISVVVAAGSGLSYNYTIDITGRSAEKILANVDIDFPTKSGLTALPVNITRQDYFNGTTTFSSSAMGIGAYDIKPDPANAFSGTDAAWVPEFWANRVIKFTGLPTLIPQSNWTNATTPYMQITAANIVGGSANAPQNPFSVAVWGNPLAGPSSGAVWVTEYYAQRISKYTFSGGSWTKAATISSPFTYSGGGTRTFGGAYLFLSITPDGSTLFVSDFYRHVVWKFNTTTLVGSVLIGTQDTPGVNIGAGDIRLYLPLNINVDPDTSSGVKLWVADYANGRVLKVSTGSTPTVETLFKDSDSTGGSLDARIVNCDSIMVCGTPGVNLFYLMVGGDDVWTSSSGIDGNQRVYKLDENFNIVAQSDSFARIGAIEVDNQNSPTYVYVGRGGSNPPGTFPQLRILNYSNLSTAGNFGSPFFGGTTIAEIHSIVHVPAFGSGTAHLLIHGQSSGLPRILKLFTSGATVSFGGIVLDPPDPYSFGNFSRCVTVAGVLKVYQTVLAPFTSGGTGSVYEWSCSDGITWTRGGSPILTLPQTPWDVEIDANNHLYVSFPFNVGYAGITTGGNYVRRYTKVSGTWTLTGTFGDGVASGSATEIAAPTAISYSAGNDKVVSVAKKSLPYDNGGALHDQSRLVFFKADDASWAANPFDHDTNNNASLSLALVNPAAVYATGDDIYISDIQKYVIYRMKKAVTGDSGTYQLVGKFGVSREQGDDHAHLSGSWGLIAVGLSGTADQLVISDVSSGRLLSVHTKMGGVSLASGNIETMTALRSNERLRVWSEDIAYMGVGSKVWTANEYIFSEQVLSVSEFIYLTTLGRSPLNSAPYANNTIARGCITRLPVSSVPYYDDTSFTCDLLKINGYDGTDYGSAMLKLPIVSHGQSISPNFSDHGSDAFLVAYPRTEQYYKNRMLRGFSSTDSITGSVFAASFNAIAGSDGHYVPRLAIRPYLIKRDGKAYLMLITRVLGDGAQNMLGDSLGEYYHAVDIFEVPGRLLVR